MSPGYVSPCAEWALALHDFWCQVAIAALLCHFGVTLETWPDGDKWPLRLYQAGRVGGNYGERYELSSR